MFLSSIVLKGKARFVTIATVLVAVAFPVAFMAGSASADGWCNYDGNNQQGYCLTTQGGAVNACDESIGSCYTPDADWSFLSISGGLAELESPNFNSCIGDYGNSSGDAAAGLDECPSQGNAGWGTKLAYGNCSNPLGGGYDFVSVHWDNWIGPASWTNGAQEYLNKPSLFCFADTLTL